MADTRTIAIVNTAWTDISLTNKTGFFSNATEDVVLFRQNDGDPGSGELDGHRMLGVPDSVNYEIPSGDTDSVWCRALKVAGTILATP